LISETISSSFTSSPYELESPTSSITLVVGA
jgi:hypothetical protein